MADGKGIVGRNITRAEAGAAEAGLKQRASLQKLLLHAVADELEIHGDGRGIDRKREVTAAHVVAVQNGGGLRDIVVHAARAACNHALIDHQLSVYDLIGQMKLCFAAELLVRPFFYFTQIITGRSDQLTQRHSLRRVEGKRRHGLEFREVDFDAAVIVRAFFHAQRAVSVRPAVDGEIFFDLLVRLPDGAQTCRLGRHHVDTDAEIHRKMFDAGARELKHLIFDKAVFIRCTAKRDGYIVRPHTMGHLACEPYEHDLRLCNIICVLQQLFDKLGAALANAHRADRAIAGVAVGAQDHFAATGHHLARVLMNDGLIGGHVIAAIFDGRGEAEDVVVLVDRSADSAEAVVAVRQNVGDREAGQAAGSGCLDDADVGDIVGDQAVEGDVELAVCCAFIVAGQNLRGDGLFLRVAVICAGDYGLAALNRYAAVNQSDHVHPSFPLCCVREIPGSFHANSIARLTGKCKKKMNEIS